MKKFSKYAFLFATLMASMFTFTSCNELEEWLEDKDEQTTYRYWKKYPQSYIQMFDHRMKFRLLSVVRQGTTVQIEDAAGLRRRGL